MTDTVFFGDMKYAILRHYLLKAYYFAAEGKGQERHGRGRNWNDQPIVRICKTHGAGFALGQAAKKIEESEGLDNEPAVRELLGAIGYLCAAVQAIEEGNR